MIQKCVAKKQVKLFLVMAFMAAFTASNAYVQAATQPLPFAPVSGTITSGFGWRSDPMGAGSRFHSGLDIAASSGTPVYAPQNGYVAYSGLYKGYGNVVVLDHGYGLYTLYGHASALYVKPGQAISRGQAIAAVGSTGRSTGPHLHFEVHQNGQYVDPRVYLSYLAQQGQSVATAMPPARGAVNASKASQPIQVTVAREAEIQPPQQKIAADTIPAQAFLLQEEKQAVGNASQGIAVTVQNASTPRKVVSKHARRVGRDLVSSAVQVVAGRRVNWVRF